MTREEAIKLIDTHTVCFYNEIDSPTLQALHLAIEALQFAEHFDLLKEFQSLQEVVHCRDCKYLNRKEAYGDEWKECTHYPQHHIRLNDFCSYGERREP